MVRLCCSEEIRNRLLHGCSRPLRFTLFTALNKLVGHCWFPQHACQVQCAVFAGVMLFAGAEVVMSGFAAEIVGSRRVLA